MQKKITVIWALLLSLFGWGALCAQTPRAEELLRRVDQNEVYQTIEYEGEMIIEYQSRRYVKTFHAWVRGNSDSFMEFTNPEDRFTRYLKRSGRLFFYSPDTEEVIPISGHLLKESLMGSDLSLEDTVNNESLESRFNAAIAGEEVFNGRPAYVLDLNAKNRGESYPRQRLWIDRENYDLLHYELFALSGVKAKEWTLIRSEVFGARRFPVESEMRDLLRRDSRTIFIMRNVILDQPIADSIFTTRNLER